MTFENDGNGCVRGGAAYLHGGTVSLTNATIVGNGRASSSGGGIDNAGANLTLVNDTLLGQLRGALETDNGTTTSGREHDHRRRFLGQDDDCVAPTGQASNGGTTPARSRRTAATTSTRTDTAVSAGRATSRTSTRGSPRSSTTPAPRGRRRSCPAARRSDDPRRRTLPDDRSARDRTTQWEMRHRCVRGGDRGRPDHPDTDAHRT